MIYLLKEKASTEQVKEMLETLSTYIKLAVDIEKKALGWRRRSTRRLRGSFVGRRKFAGKYLGSGLAPEYSRSYF